MKRALLVSVMAGLLFVGPASMPGRTASFPGVDRTVIEEVATKAGRPARGPVIDTDRGDLLLFLFLLAGAGAGFAAGYWFRALFPPGRRARARNEASAPAEAARTDGAG